MSLGLTNILKLLVLSGHAMPLTRGSSWVVVTNVAVYVGLTLYRCSGEVLYEGYLCSELRTM